MTVKTSTILIHLIYLYYQWRHIEQFVTLMTVKTCSDFMHWVAVKILFFMLWLSLFRCMRDGVVKYVSLCFIVEIHCCLCDSLFKSFFSCSFGLCSLNFRLFSLVFESYFLPWMFLIDCFAIFWVLLPKVVGCCIMALPLIVLLSSSLLMTVASCCWLLHHGIAINCSFEFFIVVGCCFEFNMHKY